MFWQGVFLLLGLRARFAVQACTRNTGRLVGLAFALLLGCPAAFAAAGQVGARLQAKPVAAESVVCGALILAQFIWIVLLVPGAGVTVGRNLPVLLLRPYPLRAGQAAIAETLGTLCDVPLLLVLPLFGTIALRMGQTGSQRFLVFAVLLLFALQTAALSQLLARVWEVLGVRAVRWQAAGAFAAAGGCLVSFIATTPSAYAALTDKMPLSLPWYAHYFSGGLAAQAIGAISQGAWWQGSALGLLLAAALGAVLWITDCLQTQSEQANPRSKAYRAVPLAPAFVHWPLLSQTAVIMGTEWRLLLRQPSTHLPLRAPASLLLMFFIAWTLSGGGEALADLRDLVAMGAICYVFLWQIQLLCNRWGNAAGTTRLLLGFPVPARPLILGRSLALLLLLIPLDAAGIVVLCLVARAPQYIGAICLWGGMTLICLTGLGTMVSFIVPFPIARGGKDFAAEPDRIVAFFYVMLGAIIASLLFPISWVAEKMTWYIAGPGAVFYLTCLVWASLLCSERLLAKREKSLIRALDGEL